MREVPATKAKVRFAELLSVVKCGETVANTGHGRAIVRLIPAQDDEADRRKEAVDRFRRCRRRWWRVEMSTDEIFAGLCAGLSLV